MVFPPIRSFQELNVLGLKYQKTPEREILRKQVLRKKKFSKHLSDRSIKIKKYNAINNIDTADFARAA